MYDNNDSRRPGGFRPGRETGHSRPRFVRNANEGERQDQHRPRFQQQGERPRFQQQGERPRFQQGERPRFQQQGERQDQHRPRFQQGERPQFGGEREMRPRRNAPKPVAPENKRQKYHEKYEDPTKPIRLNKYLANAGICSRREADDFIQAGVITVNGEVVSSLGAKVLPTDKVMFHNQPVHRERKIYILLNKPKNTVTTTDDPEERRTVIDIVRNACAERIYPVGRLDRNTTGVLLLTNDGDLAAKLTHPKFEKKKIYAATLDHELSEVDEAILRNGVVLDDERIVPDALEFTKDDRRHIGLEIHSGQNRVVRRMFEKVGYKVMTLDRVSFAGLTKKNVARGKYRYLTPKEVAMLQMGAFE
ncbi:MAG: pseudouridine synthase [Paludibacteraceae bacterium]|nr:pseudouridine synthase [Paludibacteraceae bacterium]